MESFTSKFSIRKRFLSSDIGASLFQNAKVKANATAILLGLILLAAAALRLTGVDWDDYQHHHPDERHITWIATTIEWPASWATAFIPSESSFNPYYWPPDASSEGIVVLQDEPRKFAYGHLPLYLGVAAARLVERVGPWLVPFFPAKGLLAQDILNGAGLIEFKHLTAVTRALTALFDTGTVLLVYLLGRRVYGTAVGLLAAAFLAVSVTHIQLAHFFAFDSYMTFFTVAAVYFLVRSWPQEQSTKSAASARFASLPPASFFVAAVCVGLAVGSKFAAILLVVPLAVAVWWGPAARREWHFVTAVAIAFLAFALTNPFSLLDFTCEVITPAVQLGPIAVPALDWRSCFLENISTQGAMVRGDIDLPFTRQYSGTLSYLYYVEMQLRWGLGLLLGLVAFAGFAWTLGRATRQLWLRWQTREDTPLPASFLIHAWTIPYFLSTGAFHVKFMRYFQPLIPFLVLYGAAMLWYVGRKQKAVWRYLAFLVVLLFTTLYALSFVNLYGDPHPWNAASGWIYANIEPGSVILSEQWDDALPVTMEVDGQQRLRTEYRDEQLRWLTGTGEQDDEEKLMRNLELLAESNYLTILSSRNYGVLPRLPGRYPISSQYHPLLFAGALGYEPVFVMTRTPHLFGFHLKPDRFSWPGLQPPAPVADYLAAMPGITGGRADESFLVYDQPLVIIFENTGGLTAVEMARQFDLD